LTLNGQAELNSPVIGATAHRPLRPENRCSHIDIELMTSMRNALDLRYRVAIDRSTDYLGVLQ
jgi:hypothetical protein